MNRTGTIKKGRFERFIRAFDQYLGGWVGLILASTVLMGWVEKMFVWRILDPATKIYVTVPMFPTPKWWTDPIGLISVLVGSCLAKLGHGYWVNSKWNSEVGVVPPTKSDADKPKETM